MKKILLTLVLFCISPLLYAFPLIVQLPSGATLTLEVEPGDTIEQVKTKIQDKRGLSPDYQTLKFGTTIMLDGQTLNDYGVSSSTNIISLSIIIYVKADGTGTGTSWATAYPSLQTALVTAGTNPEAQIWVANGTYKTTSTTDRNVSFNIPSGLKVYGGFVGNETLLSERPPMPAVGAGGACILSGDIGTIGTSTDNAYHVVVINSTNAQTVLDGFTITGGRAENGDYPQFNGGGILALTDYAINEATLAHCSISNNFAEYGGGIYASADQQDMALNVTNCLITNNNCLTQGGGIRIAAINGSNTSQYTQCIIQQNVSDQFGGGVCSLGIPKICKPEFKQCKITGNTASSNNGGGVYNFSGSRSQGTSPLFENCLIANNSGGGVRNDGKLARDDDSDDDIIKFCTPIFRNTSIVGNKGTAITNDLSKPELTNCIVWGNEVNIPESDVSSMITMNKTVIQGLNLGTGIFAGATDPLFMSAVVYSASPSIAGDYTLLSCSEAINAGLNGSFSNTDKDLAQNQRIKASTIDLGPYEFQGQGTQGVFAVPVVRANTTSVCSGGGVSLTATGCSGIVEWSNGKEGNVLVMNDLYANFTISARCLFCSQTSAFSPVLSIKVSPSTVNPPVIFANKTAYLEGDNATLSSLGCPTTVLWNNGMKAGAFLLQNLKVGSYSFTAVCEVLDGCTRSGNSNTVTIEVSAKVLPPVISASKSMACILESINLKATGCEGGIIKWSNGQSGQSVVYQVIADATLTAVCEKNSQISDKSNPIFIIPKQTLGIAASSTTICEGQSVSLSSTGCMGITFWNIDNKFKMGKSVEVWPSQSTIISATCDVTGECGISTAVRQAITVKEVPFISLQANSPVQVGNILQLKSRPDGMVSYRWTGPANYSSIVQNPSLGNITKSNMGFYNLVTNNGTCSASAEIFVQVLGNSRLRSAEILSDLSMNVYPNPANDIINFTVVLASPSPLEIVLIDATGRRLNAWQSAESKAIHQQKLDISAVKDGVYFILVESQTEKGIKKIVKAKE